MRQTVLFYAACSAQSIGEVLHAVFLTNRIQRTKRLRRLAVRLIEGRKFVEQPLYSCRRKEKEHPRRSFRIVSESVLRALRDIQIGSRTSRDLTITTVEGQLPLDDIECLLFT